MKTKSEAAAKFLEGYNCAQAVFYNFCDDLGVEKNCTLKLACGFGAGMGRNYQARKDMKINSEALVKGLAEGKIQLVDIRFKEEFEAWRMGFAVNIQLNELPARLNEIQKDKIIVTACPHKDRAGLAMAFLRTKGFHSKYLTDGMVGLAEYLRGDKARDFVSQLYSK